MLQQTEYTSIRPKHQTGIAAENWYAVNTRPRYEKKVADALRAKGMTVLLPLFAESHRWSDRRRVVQFHFSPVMCSSGWMRRWRPGFRC